jgi:glycosyltransferase involved in cell wall biosynthesis
MITVHLLTKNNARTIQKCLDSVCACSDRILVADLGSTDGTIEFCENAGAEIYRMRSRRDEARNRLIDLSSGTNLAIEPWEALVQGHEQLRSLQGEHYATILNQKIITKEVRVWHKGRYINPVYEHLDVPAKDSGLVFYSSGRCDVDDLLQEIQLWKQQSPTAISPFYYEACTLLTKGDWAGFLPLAEHYMFLDNSQSMPAIMLRYYYAMANTIHLRKVRPALQNLSLCLAAKPLMAEFWCLMGDIYYHLLKRHKDAKEFYENAVILGSRRLNTDPWPMDLTKYKAYPQKMIASCEHIIQNTAFYVPNRL